MRLIMCCQVIPDRDFLKDLRFSIIASIFWRRVYPSGSAFVATNGAQLVPAEVAKYIGVIGYDFEKLPGALSRTNFMLDYVRSNHFTEPTVFSGHDVIFLKALPEFSENIITNYRYHPSQPYCSDLLIVKEKDSASAFLTELFETQRWMPRPIRDGAADQLAYALTLGMPEKQQFTGAPLHCPRRSEILAIPAEQYLFTPNDFFPSKSELFGAMTESPDYDTLLREKTALHFKGNRKQEFFEFAKWAAKLGYINLDLNGLPDAVQDLDQ